jgi:hypothetical protein
MSDPLEDRLVGKPEFQQLLGQFQVRWAALELTTDYAIWKFLKTTPEQTHLITSGMMFGRKARLLADLIGRSDHTNKAAIQGVFNKLRGGNKRDVFAHSYQHSTETTVTFVDRSSGGEYRATEHTFTLAEFKAHVDWITSASREFLVALGADSAEFVAFANASLSLERKSKTSPQ